MTVNNTSFTDRLKQVFIPTPKHTLVSKEVANTDNSINEIAPECIRRSPGHENLAALDEEPDWYHE